MVVPGVKRGVAGFGFNPEFPGTVPLLKFGVPGNGVFNPGLLGELGKDEPKGLDVPPGKPIAGSLKPLGAKPDGV